VGVGASLYWSWITITTVGYGDKVPKTFWGQAATFVILIISIVLMNLVAGAIAANLTVASLTPQPLSLLDLAGTNVSVLRHSYAAALAQQVDAMVIYVNHTQQGIALVESGNATYFLSDQASLLEVNQTNSKVLLSGPSLADVQFTFLYPLNTTFPSSFYADLNFAISNFKSSDNYTLLLQQYFTTALTSSSTQSGAPFKDWIAVFVFLSVIVGYIVLVALGYLIKSKRRGGNVSINPTKEEATEAVQGGNEGESGNERGGNEGENGNETEGNEREGNERGGNEREGSGRWGKEREGSIQ